MNPQTQPITLEEAFLLCVHVGKSTAAHAQRQFAELGLLPLSSEQEQNLAGAAAAHFSELLRAVAQTVKEGTDITPLAEPDMPQQFISWLKTSGFGAA